MLHLVQQSAAPLPEGTGRPYRRGGLEKAFASHRSVVVETESAGAKLFLKCPSIAMTSFAVSERESVRRIENENVP